MGDSTLVSPKSSPSNSPIDETFNFSAGSLQKKRQVATDYFSSLPNEVKLQILSHLPFKTIARVSMVHYTVDNVDIRCVSNGENCVVTVLYSRQLIHERFIETYALKYCYQCSFRLVRSFDILIFEDAFK
jgi:hypothetical protein